VDLLASLAAALSNSYDPEDYDNEMWGGDDDDDILLDRQQFVQRQRRILLTSYDSVVATLGEVDNDDNSSKQQILKSQKKDQSNNNNNNNRHDESSNGLLNPQSSPSSPLLNTPLPQQQQRITTEQIDSIKSSISLVDVIGSYNLPQFTRTTNSAAAATARACCPFHNDNNPSLYIDNNRQLYKCFACGAAGDVFNFIREYDYLSSSSSSSSSTTTSTTKNKEKMGYMQAVEYVAREYSNDIVDLGSIWKYKSRPSNDDDNNNNVNETKKRRIRQANTAAVAYYIKCLITLPTAGKARSHLRSVRQLSSETIQSFAIGYAPDVYYGDEAGTTTTTSTFWGAGSLVEYLSNEGFTPNEIVQSGLAVRVKKTTRRTTTNNDVDNAKAEIGNDQQQEQQQQQSNDDDGNDYSDLMDRFRSRLIIPIMDDSGQFVIALGGRYLETAAEKNSSTSNTNDAAGGGVVSSTTYKPAKYINSPDSPVFTKRNVLFNKARAKRILDDSSRTRSTESTSSSSLSTNTTFAPSPAIVLVEGYFDAIALSNVGIQNVVASMGTALPVEQLKLLAEMRNSGPPGGKIILCMDNDDAGRNAVERLCSSNILSKVPELSKNELYVASLTSVDGGDSDNVKDPSDFVNFVGGGIQAGIRFQEEVLNNAIPWDEWYVDRLLSKPKADPIDGSSSSNDGINFASICNDISTFLATFSNPAERTQRVHKIGDKLVKLIANDDATSSSLGMLRAQLESDILNMSSRKAGVREAIERRIEHTDGVSGEATTFRMKRLSSGDVGTIDDDDERKMSRNAIAKLTPPRTDKISRRRSAPSPTYSGRTRKEVTRTRGYNTNQKQRNRLRADMPSEERHIVPHFNGFEFKHQSDKDWLGLDGGNGAMKSKMYLGGAPGSGEEKDRLRAETSMFEDNNYKPSRKKDDVLYFNSNRYLGKQYLLPQAVRAGYELGDERPSPGESHVEFTYRKLFQSPDPDQQIMQAESRLLHALAKFPQARKAMRSVYSTSTFGPSNLRWTSEERKWLFLCLTGSSQIDPPLPIELLDRGNQYQLHLYLANRGDCPAGSLNRNVSIRPVSDELVASSVEAIEIVIDSPVSRPKSDETMDESEDISFTRLEVEVLASENDELDSILNVPSDVDEQCTSSSSDDNILDEYFLETDMFPSFRNNKITKETRAELTVQETISTLLRASAMKRFVSAKENLTKIVHEMDYRNRIDDVDNNMHLANRNMHDFDNISSEELQTLFEKVGNEVIEAQRSLYDSERSTDRVNSHLLDYSVTNGVKYKLSQSELERLDDMMDEHIASLPESDHRPTTAGDDGSYVFGEDEFDEKINSVYGGRNPEEYLVKGLPNGETAWD